MTKLEFSLPYLIRCIENSNRCCPWTGRRQETYAIYYISKNLTPTELNYTMKEKEFLAIVKDINKFCHYITRYLVFLYTNQSSIRYLANKTNTNGQVT